MKMTIMGMAVTTAPAMVPGQSTVFFRARSAKPTGSVRVDSEFETRSGHKKSFHAPRKVKIVNVAIAGAARGRTMRRKIWLPRRLQRGAPPPGWSRE